jgi:hypothetical protein
MVLTTEGRSIFQDGEDLAVYHLFCVLVNVYAMAPALAADVDAAMVLLSQACGYNVYTKHTQALIHKLSVSLL